MIGIFDSGSGGLSVLKAIRKCAPSADVVYFGDLKNAPYGNKSREELGALTVLGIQKLIDEGATEIVSACNSVSVSIVLPMFDILDLPHANIIEMVGPTVSSFKKIPARILVVATKATIGSRVYQDGFHMIGIEADGVTVPDLVRCIEWDASVTTMRPLIHNALVPYAEGKYTHLLLGCTHYPLVHELFDEVVHDLGMQVTIVDPAVAVANKVCTRFVTGGQGSTRFLLSQESTYFKKLADTADFGAVRIFGE